MDVIEREPDAEQLTAKRAEFEAWLAEYAPKANRKRLPSGHYMAEMIEHLWQRALREDGTFAAEYAAAQSIDTNSGKQSLWGDWLPEAMRCIDEEHAAQKVEREALQRAQLIAAGWTPPGAALELAVWEGAMPESNGKSNFTALLHRKGDKGFDMFEDGITIDRSEYPDRVRYEADRVRYLIGEIAERPCITKYDADKHSGYVAPAGGQHIPGNFTTHRTAWRDAITECINAETERGNADKAAYWQHELAAYDRAFSRLLDNPEPVRAAQNGGAA